MMHKSLLLTSSNTISVPTTSVPRNTSYIIACLVISVQLYAQCPGPAPCAPGTFDNRYEQIDPSAINGAVFCSGETRIINLAVQPGTQFLAFTGDVEHISLFFDFDCNGSLETQFTDSCTYINPVGCNVDLSVTFPTVSALTTYNGRAHIAFNTPTTDPCANIGFGHMVDFTISVAPAPVITTQPTNQTVFTPVDAVFYTTAVDTDSYQWQVSTDGGGSYTNITDGTEYTGTTTPTLTVVAPEINKNGNLYRAVHTNAVAGCTETSNPATLSIRVSSVITNRRITYRSRKN